MSAEAWAVVAIAVAGWSGITLRMWFRMEQKQEQFSADLKGIGRKVTETQNENNRLREMDVDDAHRRYHNVSLAIMLISPNAREKEVCEFLKEGK